MEPRAGRAALHAGPWSAVSHRSRASVTQVKARDDEMKATRSFQEGTLLEVQGALKTAEQQKKARYMSVT